MYSQISISSIEFSWLKLFLKPEIMYEQRELSGHNYTAPPIVAGICQNDPDLVEILIKFGAAIDKPVRATQYGSWYPLDYAIMFGKKNVAGVLLSHGAKKGS